MYAITGITGKVGGALARTLLGSKQAVRAVVRDPAKASAWADKGCEVAVAEMSAAAALSKAFEGADGVFVLLPPIFDPGPGFPETAATVAALHTALESAKPARVVCISTIGAQATRPNLLTQLGMMEAELSQLSIPIAFLRPAWFMENFSWDIAPARTTGVLRSFLQPLDKAFPMVATADIGSLTAELLQQTWTGRRIVELEGPSRYTPKEVADILGEVLHRPIRAQAVPRDKWEAEFRAQGMTNPGPRIAMLDGFNEGWIDFEGGSAESQKGRVKIDEVLQELA